MNIAIIYASVHHQNTESLVKAIDAQFSNVLLIDSTKALMIDLAKYDYIGIASGIYHGKFHKTIYSFLEENLPENKKVFVMYTCSIEKPSYTHKIERFINTLAIKSSCSYPYVNLFKEIYN